MKEGKYTKTLAKIQVGAIFACEISAEMLICLIYRASETPCLCPSEWHQHGGRYICYPVFHERVNSSLEELMKIKFSFLIQLFTLDSKIFKKNKSLFNLNDNSLGHLPQ